jgi:hypothetical protein
MAAAAAAGRMAAATSTSTWVPAAATSTTASGSTMLRRACWLGRERSQPEKACRTTRTERGRNHPDLISLDPFRTRLRTHPARHRCNQAPHIHRIHGNVCLIAGVNDGIHLRFQLQCHGKA